MPKSPWQQRIRRAEKLAAQYPYAADILTFYTHLARFQEDLYNRLKGAESGVGVPREAHEPLLDPGSSATQVLTSAFPDFLALLQKKAPEALAQVANILSASARASWSELFSQGLAQVDSPTDPQEFLVLAFLQPYAEFVRPQTSPQPENSATFHCPFCHRKPALAILRPQGDGGSRSLLCGFCLTEWEFRRLICPGCGEEDHAKLPVYTSADLPAIRVECCDTCQTYIKCIDLTKSGLADPLVDELASVPLNLWAQEHGYAKLQPNLLGM